MGRNALALFLSLLTTSAIAVEITPLGGTQGGGVLTHIASGETLKLQEAPTQGLIIGWKLNREQEMELLYSRQQTRLQSSNSAIPQSDLFDLDIHTLQLGGTVLSETTHQLQGFLSGGLGITHYTPALSGADSETRASLSLGIGAKWMPVKNVGLRLEARGYGTLFNSTTSIFCSGGCTLSVSGDLLSQYALFAGIIIRLE
jgi:opacity protein-like surface antigen